MENGFGKSPGKLILSGEHSVVYGKPALVMAVNRYAQTRIRKAKDPSFKFIFDDTQNTVELAYSDGELRELFKRSNKRYAEFVDGRISIQKVLDHPLELIPYAFTLFVNEGTADIGDKVTVNTAVGIPVGCGMGSSAAVSLSVVAAAASYFDKKPSSNELYRYALTCEKLQHGTPSGVDPYISLHGGFMRFHESKTRSLGILKSRFYVALTGVPESSTGECVMAVRHRHSDSRIWDDFESVTGDLESALISDVESRIRECIRRNHRLLTEIGVVPDKVKNFISRIEMQNGAAKISGAGSVLGDSAGVVLLFTDNEPVELCRQFNYELIPIRNEENGTE